MKDGAMMAILDISMWKSTSGFTQNSVSHRPVRKNIEEYVQKDGRKLYLLAEAV